MSFFTKAAITVLKEIPEINAEIKVILLYIKIDMI